MNTDRETWIPGSPLRGARNDGPGMTACAAVMHRLLPRSPAAASGPVVARLLAATNDATTAALTFAQNQQREIAYAYGCP